MPQIFNPHKCIKSFLNILVVLSFSPCLIHAQSERLSYAAPTLLPGIKRPMKTPGFWIARHPSADQLIMTAPQVEEFNNRIQKKEKLVKDLFHLPEEFSGEELRTLFAETLEEFKNKNYYAGSARADKKFFEAVKINMNLESIPEKIQPQFGFIVHFADQRFFPTPQVLSEKPNDIDFDELQNSDLDVGTPIAALHRSRDGQWLYVLSELLDGWVEARHVVLTRRQDVEDFFTYDNFAVITAGKADIFLDLKQTQYYDYARMGVRLPIEQRLSAGIVKVRIPTRSTDGTLIFQAGYISEKNFHKGYLSYTPRHMIEQAFALLNEPYGWGGMHGEQDCSRFLQEVFATVGIRLPRNSSQQAQLGQRFAEFDEKSREEEKLKALAGAMGGITILPLPGHIMLFLGMVDDQPYAIHATSGYREKVGSKEITRVIKRVVVSDLSLGESTKKGSLLERLKAVLLISR